MTPLRKLKLVENIEEMLPYDRHERGSDIAKRIREGTRRRPMFERAIALSRTVAGAPAGLSRVAPSQAKPLIDYRKGGR